MALTIPATGALLARGVPSLFSASESARTGELMSIVAGCCTGPGASELIGEERKNRGEEDAMAAASVCLGARGVPCERTGVEDTEFRWECPRRREDAGEDILGDWMKAHPEL